MRRKIKTLSFQRGLETTGLEDGLELPAWAHFQNTRLDEGAASRRKGMQRVLTATNPATALSFNGTNQKIFYPTMAAHDLGLNWTVEVLFKPDDVTGTQALVGFDHATDWPFRIYMSGATLKADVDFGASSGAVTLTGGTITAAATSSAMLTRRTNPSDLTQYELALWTNGTKNTPTTATLASTTTPTNPIVVAADGGGNFFAGDIDFVRVLSVCRTTNEWSNLRLPDPKVGYVIMDSSMTVANATTARVDDRSSHRNHGTAKLSPSSTTTLATQTAPITHIGQRIDYQNESRIDIVAGGQIYLGTL